MEFLKSFLIIIIFDFFFCKSVSVPDPSYQQFSLFRVQNGFGSVEDLKQFLDTGINF